MAIPLTASSPRELAPIGAYGGPAVGDRQSSPDVRGECDDDFVCRLEERAGASHLGQETRIGPFVVDHGGRVRMRVFHEINEVETVVLAQAHRGDHQVVRIRFESRPRGLERRASVDTGRPVDRRRKSGAHDRIRIHQQQSCRTQRIDEVAHVAEWYAETASDLSHKFLQDGPTLSHILRNRGYAAKAIAYTQRQ
jgi:hypothetical protein